MRRAKWYTTMTADPDRNPAGVALLDRAQRGGGALVVMAVEGQYQPHLGLLAIRCDADGRMFAMWADDAHVSSLNDIAQSNPRRVAEDEDDGA
jgi:hypothetical protein